MTGTTRSQAQLDYQFMARALQLAKRGYYTARPNPRVGCVLTRGTAIIGEGYHQRAGEAHAEINALAQVDDASGATAYVSLEPCAHHGRTPPCAEKLIAAKLARVVFAVADPNPQVAGRGAELLRAAGIAVTESVMVAQATAINRGFFHRMQFNSPHVTIKLGMSVDAKVALSSGASQWITSPQARADVQRLRAQAGAIVTGVGTVVSDDPQLTVRDPQYADGLEQPLRVVLDPSLRSDPDARIYQAPGRALIYTANSDELVLEIFRRRGIEVVQCAAEGGSIDLAKMLHDLGARQVNDVLVETGPTLAAAFIEAQCYNEIITYIAPKLIGADARDAFAHAAPSSLEALTDLEYVDVRRVGADLRLTLAPRGAVAT